MWQSNSVTRGRLLRAIRDFLKVPREKAKSGSKTIEKIYEEVIYVAQKLKPREVEASELDGIRDIIMLASQSSEISRSMKQRLLEPFDDPEVIDAEKFVAQELRKIEKEKLNMALDDLSSQMQDMSLIEIEEIFNRLVLLGEPAIPFLIKQLGDEQKTNVRILAGNALIKMGEIVVPYLLDILKNGDFNQRYEAGEILQRFGKYPNH
jgi:hypothetical protein